MLQEKQEVKITNLEHIEQEIQIDYVRKALKELRSNRTLGQGGIKTELWKYGEEKLTKIFQKIDKGQSMPLKWNTSYIFSIFKKKNEKKYGNYRGLNVRRHE